MKHILIDKAFDGTLVTQEFKSSYRVPAAPQIQAGNVGRTMVRTMSERMVRDMDASIRVQRSGSLARVLFEGPRFTLDPGMRFGEDGETDAFDSEPVRCGKDSYLHIARAWVLDQSTWPAGAGATDYFSVRMKSLDHSMNIEEDRGVAGILVALEKTVHGASSTYRVMCWRMFAYEDGAAGALDSWRWIPWGGNGKSAYVSDIGALGGGALPSLDVCELPDGTLVMGILIDGTMSIYRSHDAGASWYADGSEDIPIDAGENGGSIALETIGWTIIAAWASYEDLGDNQPSLVVGSMVSIDCGYTWENGAIIYQANDYEYVDVPWVDLCRTHDGRVLLCYIRADSVSPTNLSHPFCTTTRDGFNWVDSIQEPLHAADGSPNAKVRCFSAQQLNCGTFATIYVSAESEDLGAVLHHYSDEDAEVPVFGGTTQSTIALPNGLPEWGMSVFLSWSVCLRNFQRGGFADIAIPINDGTVGDEETTTLVVFRVAMWDGVLLRNSHTYPVGTEYEAIWGAWEYPSTDDPVPHSDYWTRIVNGAGAAALTDVDGGYLALSGATHLDNVYYSTQGFAEWAGADGNGVMARFAVKAVTGRSAVLVTASSATFNKEIAFGVEIIKGAPSTIKILDLKAGSAVLGTFAPTNWDVDEWQYYTVLYSNTSVKVYRSPGEWVHDLAACELILEAMGLTEVAYTSDNSGISWGIFPTLVHSVSESHWRFVAFEGGAGIPGYTWDPDEDTYGARVSTNDLGIGAGVSVGFLGSPFVTGDEWKLGTDFLLGTKNLFSPSPSIMWREPDQIANVASPERVMVATLGNDVWGEKMQTRLDGFAMFGRNFRLFKVEARIASSGMYVTMFDTSAGDDSDLCEWEVASRGVICNKVRVWPRTGIPATFEPMVPGMFASDGWRNYYLAFTSGSASGTVLKILGNSSTTLVLEANAEEYGARAGDQFVIFGSSFMHLFESPGDYQGFRLTIYTQKRSLDEAGLQLGTLVVGEAFELPDEEWGFAISQVPAVTNVKGRSGFEHIKQMGRVQRMIDLKFTGMIDAGVGIVPPVELFRNLRSGELPLVWYDDESPQDNDSASGLHEPILARITKAPCVSHASFAQYDEGDPDGMGRGEVRRNVVNVDSMTLAEVL